ncbi:MAG: hypothetical protein PHF87_07210 [Desulfotomaculaceae bacterium]|nr:hypothetical protein [Desulfotomaculaceae bacterium]
MKKVLAGILAIMLLVLAGCAKTDMENDKLAKLNQEELMNQYQILINENKPAGELTGFIKANLTSFSQENLDKAVISCLEVMQTQLKDYEDKMFSNDINIPLNNYKHEDLVKLQNIKEETIKNLLQDAFSNGYKLSQSEGMYYPEIDYDLILKEFGGQTSDQVAGYLEIMAAESNKHFASDAALLISPDELANRTVKTEKYIGNYPDFALIQQVKQFHGYYLKAYLLGLNNTPLFDYQTEKAKDSFIQSYEKTIAENKETKLAGILEEYLSLLDEYDYTKSEEIMDFVTGVTSDK